MLTLNLSSMLCCRLILYAYRNTFAFGGGIDHVQTIKSVHSNNPAWPYK